MKGIIFVNPPLSLEQIYGDFSGMGTINPPVTLAILAAITRKAGYPSQIIDCPAEMLSLKEVTKVVARKNPALVGLSPTTLSVSFCAKLADMIKSENSNIKIAVGGPHISAVPEKTMEKFHSFDYGIIGEGDETVIDLLKVCEGKMKIDDVDGIIYRKKKLIMSKPRDIITELDKLPFPAWDLLKGFPKKYQPAIFEFKQLPAAPIITSRGCPHNCIFCSSGVFGKRIRTHSAGYMISMLNELVDKYGIKEFVIGDDNFLMFRKNLNEFLDMLIEQKKGLSWSCNARVNLVNPDSLKKMAKAGCWKISYGMESGSEKMLRFLQKGITKEQVINAIKWTKQAGIKSFGYFIMGCPTETKETLAETANFIQMCGVGDMQISFFTPFPGSPVYQNIRKYGHFEENWDNMKMFNPTFVPKGLTLNYIKKKQKETIRKFYLRPEVVIRYSILILKNPKYFPKFFKTGLAFLRYTLKK